MLAFSIDYIHFMLLVDLSLICESCKFISDLSSKWSYSHENYQVAKGSQINIVCCIDPFSATVFCYLGVLLGV